MTPPKHEAGAGTGAGSGKTMDRVVAFINVGAAYFALFLIPVVHGYLRRRYAGAGML